MDRAGEASSNGPVVGRRLLRFMVPLLCAQVEAVGKRFAVPYPSLLSESLIRVSHPSLLSESLIRVSCPSLCLWQVKAVGKLSVLVMDREAFTRPAPRTHEHTHTHGCTHTHTHTHNRGLHQATHKHTHTLVLRARARAHARAHAHTSSVCCNGRRCAWQSKAPAMAGGRDTEMVGTREGDALRGGAGHGGGRAGCMCMCR